MNAHMTKNRIRNLAASAVIAGGVMLTPHVGAPASQASPAAETVEHRAADLAGLADFATAHHLTGLSPASLAPVPLGCRGLSPASAQNCVTEDLRMFHTEP